MARVVMRLVDPDSLESLLSMKPMDLFIGMPSDLVAIYVSLLEYLIIGI